MNQVNTFHTPAHSRTLQTSSLPQKQTSGLLSLYSTHWLLPAFGLFFLLFTGASPLSAQPDLNDDGLPHRIEYGEGSERYVDYQIPIGIEGELHFTLNGGDGGRRVVPGLCKRRGGEAATVKVAFSIGSGANQLEPGGVIRFIVGERGENERSNGVDGAGGGGGTGVLYKAPGANITCSGEDPSLDFNDSDNCWILLGVAGGGGGAWSSGVCEGDAGRGGRTSTSGGDGGGGVNGGSNGSGGDAAKGGGGGGYRSIGQHGEAGGGEAGGFTGGGGGLGETSDGGEGYGGGGGGRIFEGGGGGGGGFSGGGGSGAGGPGGGGGSFANAGALSSEITGGGTKKKPRSGYADYQFKDVTFTDPIAVCQDITVELDATGNAVFTVQDVDDGSYHPLEEPFEMCLGQIFIGCIGDLITVDCSSSSNESSILLGAYEPNPDGIPEVGSFCIATVTVEDNLAPTALCKQNLTVMPDLSGEVSITPGDVNNGSFDNCGIASLQLDRTTFTCDDIGTHTVTLNLADESDNFSSCTTTVEVVDYVTDCPEDYCVTIPTGADEVYLDFSNPPISASCGVIIESRICQTDGIGLECTPSSGYNAADKSGLYGPGKYAIFWRTVKNGSATLHCVTNITVAPSEQDYVFTCADDFTVTIPDGVCEVEVDLPDFPVIAPCGYEFDSRLCMSGEGCYPVVGFNTENKSGTFGPGEYTLLWRGKDDSGSIYGLCSATFTVIDNTDPTIQCQNATVVLDTEGNGATTVAALNAGASDACGIASVTASQTEFDCTDVGNQTVVLTATDQSGNINTCTATVSVIENTAPVAVCQDITVSLTSDGTRVVESSEVDNNSSDNCPGGIESRTLDINTFDCSDIGTPTTVTLTVTDKSGNSSTCTASISVEDNIAPQALCKNITVQLNASGSAMVTAAEVDNGSSDACGIGNISLSKTSFDCTNVGSNTVSLTVTDVNGNNSSCSATVTVEDNTAPSALCQNVTVQLDANGNGTITAADIDGGSSDNCSVQNISTAPTSFDCGSAGATSSMLTVTDVNGNSSTCNANVTVQDNVAPTAGCQDVTVQLDATGNASIAPADIDGGSTDNCGLASLSAAPTSFTCADTGTGTSTLTVTDVNGNSSTCNAYVTMEDNVPPTALCQNATVEVDQTLTPSQVDGGSTDDCAVTQLSVAPYIFGCGNIGTNTVTLTATDAAGNPNTCTATVTVVDNNVPTAVCADPTVNLTSDGTTTVDASFFDGGSSAVCGGLDFSASMTDFNCDDIGNTYDVTLTVTSQSNGQFATCTASVTVDDPNSFCCAPPMAVCEDITVQLDAAGNASINPANVGGNSTAECGLASKALDIMDFDCADVGPNSVMYTITDVNNDSDNCTATVTVEDNVAPQALCQNITVQLDASGSASIAAADVDGSSTDNCGISGLSVSPNTFDCGNTGVNTATLTVSDANGNMATCTANVIVEDNAAPIAACLTTTIKIGADGTYTLAEGDLYDATNSSDNCDIASVSFPTTTFDCDDLDLTFPVTVTVTDPSGNSDNCTANITVDLGDALPPGWTANDIGDQGTGSDYAYDPCARNNPNQGDFTISTGGYNLIPNTSDNLAFAGRELCNNGGIQAHIEDVSGGYAGLMIRESSAPGAKMIAIYSNLTSLLRREIRTVDNGPRSSGTISAPSPYWLRLVRQGNYIRAFYRTADNGSWTLFYQTYLPMQECVEMGLAVFTTTPNGQVNATFSRVQWQSNAGGNNLTAPNGGPISDALTRRDISVFPNPTRASFTLAFSKALESNAIATLRNQMGQAVAQRQLQPGEWNTDWNVSGLPGGLYLIEIREEGMPPQVLRIIKTE